MWTNEKLEAAAEEWNCKWHRDNLEDILHGRKSISLAEAFLAGCEYIINNTQKEYGE